jgi:hypothetical protein
MYLEPYLAMNFLRTRKPKPTRPAPRSVRVAGSGTAFGTAFGRLPCVPYTLLKRFGGVAGKERKE